MFLSDNFIYVSSKDGASIKVSKYGGQLLSWVYSLQEEMLYLSEKAHNQLYQYQICMTYHL